MTTTSNVYLDYASGTPVDSEVMATMRAFQENNFAHPLSLHASGRAARTAREEARTQIASIIGARAEECLFTLGGTDAITKAIHGVINALREKGIAERDMHIVMSVIEHANTRACVEGFSRRGIKTSIVGVTAEGIIDTKQLREAIRPETVLVITMLVNNEIGTVQPIREIKSIIEETQQGRKAVLVCDASQAPLAIPINVQGIGADLMIIDAHKLYGPFATGLLYVRTGTPYIGLCGAPGKAGEQGSPDVGAIAGMARALQIAEDRRETDVVEWQRLKSYCITALQGRFPGMRIHGDLVHSVPNILNISFPNIDGEFLVTRLDHQGVAVSAKSACLSGGGEGSYVIQAIDPARANNSIRISFGRETTRDDIDVSISALSDCVVER